MALTGLLPGCHSSVLAPNELQVFSDVKLGVEIGQAGRCRGGSRRHRRYRRVSFGLRLETCRRAVDENVMRARRAPMEYQHIPSAMVFGLINVSVRGVGLEAVIDCVGGGRKNVKFPVKTG